MTRPISEILAELRETDAVVERLERYLPTWHERNQVPEETWQERDRAMQTALASQRRLSRELCATVLSSSHIGTHRSVLGSSGSADAGLSSSELPCFGSPGDCAPRS